MDPPPPASPSHGYRSGLFEAANTDAPAARSPKIDMELFSEDEDLDPTSPHITSSLFTLSFGSFTLFSALKADGALVFPWAALFSIVVSALCFVIVHQMAKVVYTVRAREGFSRKDFNRRMAKGVAVGMGSASVISFLALLTDYLDHGVLWLGSWAATFSLLYIVVLLVAARDVWWIIKLFKRSRKKKKKLFEQKVKHGARAVLQLPIIAFLALLAYQLDHWHEEANRLAFHLVLLPLYLFFPVVIIVVIFQNGKPFLGDVARGVFILLFIAIPFLVSIVNFGKRVNRHSVTSYTKIAAPVVASCFFLTAGRLFVAFVVPLVFHSGGGKPSKHQRMTDGPTPAN